MDFIDWDRKVLSVVYDIMMNPKKLIASIVFGAAAVGAIYYGVKKIEEDVQERYKPAVIEETAKDTNFGLLEKVEKLTEEERASEDPMYDEASLKGIEDLYWRADGLPGIMGQAAGEPRCREKENFQGFGLMKACQREVLGIFTIYNKQHQPKYISDNNYTERDLCDIIMKTGGGEITAKGLPEDMTALWATDEYCDGKVDMLAPVYEGVMEGPFDFTREEDERFFEESVDKWWAAVEKKLVK